MATNDGSAPAYPCKIISTTYPGLTKREAMAMHICRFLNTEGGGDQ